MKKIPFLIILAVSVVTSWVLSREYREREYASCKKSIIDEYYTFDSRIYESMIATCKENGDGDNIGGGCEHIYAFRYSERMPRDVVLDYSVCE